MFFTFTTDWDFMIDNIISQSKDASGKQHTDKAAIIHLDSGAKWTSDEKIYALKITQEESAQIVGCFKRNKCKDIMAEGVKYQLVQDNNIKVAKKKGHGTLIMLASKGAIVIGHCKEIDISKYVMKGVAVVASYLESLGM